MKLLKTIANLVPPHAFEVNRIADVSAEIFGPVLRVVRWGGDPPTWSIRSTRWATAARWASDPHRQPCPGAGALRPCGQRLHQPQHDRRGGGVQPFGGEGLSGTGPKAGGPHYLYRFCAEQTVSINTTAAGGNATLLAGMHCAGANDDRCGPLTRPIARTPCGWPLRSRQNFQLGDPAPTPTTPGNSIRRWASLPIRVSAGSHARPNPFVDDDAAYLAVVQHVVDVVIVG